MDFVIEPYIDVIASSRVDMAAIVAYANAHGMSDLCKSPDSPLCRMIDDHSSGKLSDMDFLAEFSGRMCYRAFGKGRSTEDYISHVINERHGNVFIHPNVTFVISGVSRSLTHQLVRHHVGCGPSQESQRFVTVKTDEGDIAVDYQSSRVVIPPLLAEVMESVVDVKAKEFLDKFLRDTEANIVSYNELAELYTQFINDGNNEQASFIKKRVNEAARGRLPQDMETRLVWTSNLRAAFNFLERRGNIHADLEIRRLAVMMLEKYEQIAPITFKDFAIYVDADGRRSVKCPEYGI